MFWGSGAKAAEALVSKRMRLSCSVHLKTVFKRKVSGKLDRVTCSASHLLTVQLVLPLAERVS